MFDVALIVLNASVACYALYLIVVPILSSMPCVKTLSNTKVAPTRMKNSDRIAKTFVKLKNPTASMEKKEERAWMLRPNEEVIPRS